MSIHVALRHQTRYRYTRPISLGPQVIRLRPAPHSRTPILAYSLKIEPAGHFLNWQQDPQGNFLARTVFPEKTKEFSVTVDLIADMAVIKPFDFFLEPQAETFPFTYDPILDEELAPFRKLTRPGPLLKKYLDLLRPEPGRTIDTLVGLNQKLQKDIGYVVRMEPGVQTPEETLGLGRGSCRDTGWLLVQILRHFGFAARYVSGYLRTYAPDGAGIALVGADATHAWVSVWCGAELGWLEFDPTNALLVTNEHIAVAYSRDFSDVTPLRGVIMGGGAHLPDVKVTVTPLDAVPPPPGV